MKKRFRSNQPLQYMLVSSEDNDGRRGNCCCRIQHNSELPAMEMTQDRRIWWYKSLKLVALMLTTSVWAFNLCIGGPAIPDLRGRLHISMEEMARSTMAAQLGNIVGSVAGGLLSDRLSRFADLFVSGSLFGIGVCLVLRPWSPSLIALCLNTFLDGLCGGVLITAVTTIHFGMWGSASTPMYIKALGWTITCPIIPLLAKNYLSKTVYVHGSGEVSIDNKTLEGIHPPSPFNASHPWWQYGDDSRIEIPFAICAALPLILAFVYLGYYLVGTPKGYEPLHKAKGSWREVFSLGSCSGGNAGFSMYVIMSALFYFFLWVASNVARWELVFSYVIEPSSNLNFTKDEASYLSTACSTSHFISRVVCIFISSRVPIRVIMAVSVLGSFVTNVGFTFLGLHNKTYIWVFSVLMDLFHQSIWPGALVWVEGHIQLYATVIGVFEIGKSASGMAFSWISGKLYDVHPIYAFYLAFGFNCVFTVHCIVTEIVVTRWHNKLKSGNVTEAFEMSDNRHLLADDSGPEEDDVTEFEVIGGKLPHLSVDGDKTPQMGDDI